MTLTQKINMAYIMFSKYSVYKSALRKRIGQLEDHQNWGDFNEYLHFANKFL